MSEEPEEYLAVLKASYDYDPQSEEEIAIKEDQLLFLLQRVDEDWWKVKIKGESQEEETGSGLVPAAYVEQAPHTSTVKALFDYEANAPGELTIKEDDILLVFGQEDAWLLVQADGGKAGFVPENYTEAAEGAEDAAPPAASHIIIPPSPARPVSTYVDPAVRVAEARVTADDIKTWPVSEVDKKGKKKKGTLGIGNGAIFFASDSDKTPVQKWQVVDIQDTSIEKSKHVHIEVGGAMATSLHFNAGSKDTAEAIITKLEASKAYSVQPRPSVSSEQDTSPSRAVTPSKSKNGASVHFDPTSPTVIPRSRSPSIASYAEADVQPQEEDVEEEEHIEDAAPAPEDDVPVEDGDVAEALYDFDAAGEDELSVKEGEQLMILERDGDEWWKCRNAEGAEGVVPASYLESKSTGSAPAAAPAAGNDGALQAQEEKEREEQRKLKEQTQAEKEKKRRDDDNRARAAAASAEADKKRREREKQKEAAEADAQRRRDAKQAEQSNRIEQERRSSTSQSNGDASSTRRSEEPKRAPPPDKTRMWRDRTGQFRVEAAFLGFNAGKLRLHKVNGVVIEVPSERMSPEDMQYVEERMSKKSRKSAPPRKVSDEDDIPLGEHRKSLQAESQSRKPSPKKGPTMDWFEFFLNAGCDVDDCTRYATSFERDKIDEAILPDITDATMRSLGLREGDIIRVTKAIALRNPKKPDPSPSPQEQMLRDEALAKQMQEEERTGKARKSASPAPNLFAGPDGVLKPARRGRPQPSKSGPASNVDISRINSASDNIQRTSSPMAMSPASVQTPARTGSVSAPAPVVNGFDDDAWTPRPGSVKPTPTPPVTQPQASTPAPAPTPPAAPPAPPAPALPAAQPVQHTQPHLAQTTESDIFDQLARLSSLRAQSPAVAVPLPVSPAMSSSSPASYRAGLGMGPSPIPIGQHAQNQQSGQLSQNTSQQNGARGPYAPVPANQGLLQPLIPTTTGFNNFVPTRNNFQPQPAQFQPQTQPSFIQSQITGFPNNPQPMMSQPTGYPSMAPMAAQPTGMFGGNPGGYGGGQSYQNNGGFNGVQTNPTGFNPGFGQSPFGNPTQSPFGNPSSPPPLPPMPSNNTAPANIFAQMKSGTFAAGNDNGPQSQDKYDALRPNPLVPQATGWGNPSNGFQGAYPAYR